MMKKYFVSQITGILITVLTPLVILMITVRILLTPAFIRISYSVPGFPKDPYGFSKEDRLHWSKLSVNYLTNSNGITYLSSLQFDDGLPVFNDRELSHMDDVKTVVTGMRIALGISVLVLIGVSYSGIKQKKKYILLRSYYWSGWAVIALISLIFLFVAINFDSLFSWFHMLFFEEGSWQFFTSDTLIRLFPLYFWQNAFIAVGLLCLAIGILLILLCKPYKMTK